MVSFTLKKVTTLLVLSSLIACVDVEEAKNAANEVIENAAQAAQNTNNGDNNTLSWEEREEQFWTQPLSEILKQVKVADALEKTVTTCGNGTEAPSFYSVSFTEADANHSTSIQSEEAAQMLSCHFEWQSRYVARLFPEYTSWLHFSANPITGYSPFLYSRISQGPAETDIDGVTDICSNERDFVYVIYECHYPAWTDGLAAVDQYPHALWSTSQHYESYQFQHAALNVELLWREDNWKSTLRHYFSEEGTREVRGLALYGLATKRPNTDENGNAIPWVVNSYHSPTFEDSQKNADAFTAKDTVIYKVGTHLGW